MAARKETEKDDTKAGSIHTLRDDAEKRLVQSAKISPDLTGQTAEELIHELQVNQIELEMQAEELMNAKLALEDSRDWFLDLYEFAPLGYLTLSDKALIEEVNLTGATLLGVEQSKLVNARFRKFIAPEDLQPWDRYFVNVLTQGGKLICTLTIKRGDGSTFPARLESIRITDSTKGNTTVRVAVSDISDIRKAEEVQKNQYLLLNGILESTDSAVFSLDRQYRYTSFNSHHAMVMKMLYGATIELGRSIFDYQSVRDDQVKAKFNIDRALAGEEFVEQAFSGEETRSRRYFEVPHRPVKDAGNTVIGVAVFAQDITDRKKAEDALRESEGRYRRITEGLTDYLYTVRVRDDQAVSTTHGVACLAVTGYTADEFAADPYLWIRMVFNLDRDRVIHHVNDVLKGKPVPPVEHRIVRKDGRIRWVRDTPILHLDATGHLVSYDGVIKDINGSRLVEEQIKTSEIRYRRLFESAQDGILIVNRDTGRIIDSNPFIENLMGYSKEELIGKPLWEIGFIKDQVASKLAFEELQAKEYIRYEDLPLETKDGRRIEVEFVSNVYTIDPHASVIQCSIRDITERMLVEKALRVSNKKLKLLSSITRHDINNQMAMLRGFTTLLEREQIDPSFAEYFQKINASAERISAMIQFTKIYESIGVNAAIWQDAGTLVDAAAKDIAQAPVRLENAIPARTAIFADPLIVKVFYNLMDNAVRHGGPGTTIRFTSKEQNGKQLIVCEDDGAGVPANEKEKIFERGYGKNTGLGLFLSREILDITGITIKETGEPGKGARFEMTVPKGIFRQEAGSP